MHKCYSDLILRYNISIVWQNETQNWDNYDHANFVNEKLLPTIWNIWYISSMGKRTISRDPYGWLVGHESMFRRIPMRITNNFRDIEFQSIINDIHRQLYVNEQGYIWDGLIRWIQWFLACRFWFVFSHKNWLHKMNQW